jgi:hypothetical protein
MKIKNFITAHNIDKIVDSFSKISDKVLQEVPEDKWIWMTEDYGDGENCRTRALEIWAPNEPKKNYQDLFRYLHNDIEKIPNCIQAYVIYVEPKSSIPQHIDDNEGFFIITAVNEILDNWLEIDEHKIYFNKGRSIGIKPDIQYHGGENISDRHWIFFVVCLHPHPFDNEIFLIE